MSEARNDASVPEPDWKPFLKQLKQDIDYLLHRAQSCRERDGVDDAAEKLCPCYLNLVRGKNVNVSEVVNLFNTLKSKLPEDKVKDLGDFEKLRPDVEASQTGQSKDATEGKDAGQQSSETTTPLVLRLKSD